MEDYTSYSRSNIVEVDEDIYLVQGNISDELVMYRPIDELLECERDSVQKMLGEAYEESE